MTEWTVRRSSVTYGGGCREGITCWFVHTDGCTPEVVLPHVTACLETLDIAGRIRQGAYPFFYVIDLPYPMQCGQEEACAELLRERTIKGKYCNEAQRGILIREFVPVKITSVRQKDQAYTVEVSATTIRPITLLVTGEASCKKVTITGKGRGLLLEVDAKNEADLAAHLRLAGNMMQVRWDPREEVNRQFFGEPLV